MQLIPRGAFNAAGFPLPPHYVSLVDGRMCLYCPTGADETKLSLVGDGVSIADAYQAWVDTLGLPVLVFQNSVGDPGWYTLAFEEVPR